MPNLEKKFSQWYNLINGKTQGHDCDTDNMPITGRMQALSSVDSDIFWWHKPFWKNIW